jgi:hypothetical protein
MNQNMALRTSYRPHNGAMIPQQNSQELIQMMKSPEQQRYDAL